MTQDEFLNLLTLKGRNARKRKAEVQVEVCFYCGNTKWNLECNTEIGAYHCWVCGAHGNLGALVQEFFGVRAVFNTVARRRPEVEFKPTALRPILSDLTPGMEALLERRGIGPMEIARYKVQACVADAQPDYFLRVFWPLEQYWTRAEVGLLGRSLDGRKPRWLFTGTDREIVGYRAPGVHTHVLVEGVIDAIKVHQAGYNVGVLLGTMNHHLPEWAALVPPDDLVVVLLDGDAPLEAQKLYWDLIPIHANTTYYLLPQHLDPGILTPSVLRHLLHTVVANPLQPERTP